MKPVRVEVEGHQIALRTPYTPSAPDEARAVGGGHWSKRENAWLYPLDLGVCRRMRAQYGDRLVIGPALGLWARQAVAREKALPALAASDDAPVGEALSRLAPDLAAALRPYQRVGARFILEAARDDEGVLLADEPRTGKTLQTIAGILSRGDKAHGLHLIAAPRLSVRNVWEKELLTWTTREHVGVYAASGNKRERQAAIGAAQRGTEPIRFLIVNPDMCRYRVVCEDMFCRGASTPDHTSQHRTHVEMDYQELFAEAYASLVLDESHKVLGSLRTNKGTQAAVGLKNLVLAPYGTRVAVTGTPFGKGGRVQGMFGTLHWLRPKVYTSFWRWAKEVLEITEDDYGHQRVGGLKSETSPEEFFRSLGTLILRRTRAEVMPWLGGKVYEDVYCEMDPKQRTQYKAMEKNASVDGMVALGVLAELTRLKQFAGCYHEAVKGEPRPTTISGKLPALLQRLEEHGVDRDWQPGDEKAIVFTQFEAWARLGVMPALQAAGLNPVTITGQVSDADRTARVKAFQAGDGPNVIVMTTQTGGVSITLDRADSVHMLDEMWNPEDNSQAEDRAVDTTVRDEPKPVAVYYYRSEGTVEEYVRDQNRSKASEQHLVLDGRRGLEYARTLRQRG